jgi:hypothetical protein
MPVKRDKPRSSSDIAVEAAMPMFFTDRNRRLSCQVGRATGLRQTDEIIRQLQGQLAAERAQHRFNYTRLRQKLAILSREPRRVWSWPSERRRMRSSARRAPRHRCTKLYESSGFGYCPARLSQQKGCHREEDMACCRRWPRAIHKRRGTALSPAPSQGSAAPTAAPAV